VGQNGNGGHAHNDQLSFELAVQGVSLFIDPGTYVYTPYPEERNRFRSTAMHNTVSIEGMEQNRWDPSRFGLFQLKDRAVARVVKFEEGLFIGEHSGFGSVHRRTLRINERGIEGVDECALEKKQINFHFAPGWKGEQLSATETVWVKDGVKVHVTAKSGVWRLGQGWYSKGYGEKEEAAVLVLESISSSVQWFVRPS
jgi:hypothetical protein